MSSQGVLERTILIASSNFDAVTWEPVAADLTNRGYDVIAYKADDVANGTSPLEISMNNDTGLSVTYEGRPFVPQDCSAAWYRRSTLISNALENRAKQLGIDSERKVLQAAIWDEVPRDAWLNSPRAISHAEKKLTQLVVANTIGFKIPDTVVSNDWRAIIDGLPEEVVFKTSYPLILFCDNSDLQTLFTTPLQNPAELPIAGNPFPGLWQSRVQKAREWRITVVGDQTFDVAIYTGDDAKDDWRKHHDIPGQVTFRSEAFPDEYKSKCFAYLGNMGLRFGAFDFIEEPSGDVTFLECNANGQFGWLEDLLDLPISRAVADELAAIAQKR